MPMKICPMCRNYDLEKQHCGHCKRKGHVPEPNCCKDCGNPVLSIWSRCGSCISRELYNIRTKASDPANPAGFQ